MRIIFLLKKNKKKWGKNAKNLLGVFAQVKIGKKKTIAKGKAQKKKKN